MRKRRFTLIIATRSKWYRRPIFWSAIFVCILLIGSDYAIRRNLQTGSKKSFELGKCYCGQSIAEAKQLGCEYESVTISWQPVECFDEELNYEFDHAGPDRNGEWPYYADVEGKQRISLEEVALMADTNEGFYAIHSWHLAHCNYVWRKLLRSLTNGITIDSDTASLKHIVHCGSLESSDWHNTSLNALATFASNSLIAGKLDHV
jgi:hypothetical protein